MADDARKNFNNTTGGQSQSKQSNHELVAVQDCISKANADTPTVQDTAKAPPSDNESDELEPQPTNNTAQCTLTLEILGLFEENLGHGIEHWLREEKKDGGVRFYAE